MNGPAFAKLDDIATATAPQALARLAIIVPCYNEAESIDRLADGLTRVRAALASRYETEVILIDDGSCDGTEELLRDRFAGDNGIRVLRHTKNMGIAGAIGTGIRQSRSEIVASLDADCTYDPLQLVDLLERLSDGIDVVVASPYHPAGGVIGVPQWRLALSRFASRLYGLVMRNQLHTYTSCVRVYRRSAVIDLPLEHPGFVGIVELLWQLDRRGGRIAECPAVLTARTTGHSKMRIIRAVAAHLQLLVRAALSRYRISPPAHVAHEQTTYVARFSETTP